MATYVRTGQTVVYCSPTVRTAETADIVCSAFGIDRAVPSVYLENGDLGSLYRYILINNRNSTVILVGHTPYLEAWLRLWTGTSLEFSRAAAALIDCDLDEGAVGQGKILAYLNPSALPG